MAVDRSVFRYIPGGVTPHFPLSGSSAYSGGVLRSPHPSLVFWPGQYGGDIWAVPSFTEPLAGH